MKGIRIGWRQLTICALVLGLSALAAPAMAQTGSVKGRVVDQDNKAVDGATVTIESADGGNRRFEVKTNGKGEFIQIGLQPGDYTLTAKKGDLTQSFRQHISLDMAEVNFSLKPAAASASEADRKKAEAIKGAFEEGVALSNAGKYDEAIAKFTEVAGQVPKCPECYTNIGAMYGSKKEWDQAEAAYKQALEQDPNSAAAYTGLANVYNAQKKFDQAAEASAQAMKLGEAAGGPGGGASASAVYNQGIILWNAGKIPEAKEQFAKAVQLDPKLADAHYWLGMAIVNEGKLDEAAAHFDEYLKLAPTGQFAEQAKQLLATIKK